MPVSLSDLRSTPVTERPKRSVNVNLAPELVARAQIITDKLTMLTGEPDQDGATPPRTVAGTPGKRALEDELIVLLEKMAEHEGDLTVRANLSDGEWRQWVNAHPARDEGQKAEHARDNDLTGGRCNSDALLDDLGTFIHAWNGEPLAADDWAQTIEPRLAAPDKHKVVREIVLMYEVNLDFRLWRTILSASLTTSNDSSSPAPSASATSDSTGGSLAPSSAATTETATP